MCKTIVIVDYEQSLSCSKIRGEEEKNEQAAIFEGRVAASGAGAKEGAGAKRETARGLQLSFDWVYNNWSEINL